MQQRKVFEIPKQLIWESYQQVRQNKGAPGIDEQTIKQFDKNRDKNLYKIWNRLSSGTYFPPPVLEKRIPKADGKERILGIPTVSDRIAQGAIKIFIERKVDPIFHSDSYGYRPNKSAHQALETCKQRCWNHSWVLEIDIKAFFDNVRHDLIIKALEHLKMPQWVILYSKRWMRAPMTSRTERNELKEREVGTPQGGVISPLLANLFLHYTFDVWMNKFNQKIPFERYADDIICHCNTMKEAMQLMERLKSKV
jgi:group II intron reverse transcriptase/maturase